MLKKYISLNFCQPFGQYLLTAHHDNEGTVGPLLSALPRAPSGCPAHCSLWLYLSGTSSALDYSLMISVAFHPSELCVDITLFLSLSLSLF